MAQRGQRIPSRIRVLGSEARLNCAQPHQAQRGREPVAGRLLRFARRSRLEAEHAMKEIGALQALHGSVLKIVCPDRFSSEFLPGVLAAFKARRAGFPVWCPCAPLAIVCPTR
ncbi:conserved hypothetical protein [Burkholderia vietnamiensis]|nr:conserved hypothetical protein [Burkholderia vietnamiensis]